MQAGNTIYSEASDFPETVPLFPLSGALLLPGGQMPLNIFEPRYMAMFDAAIASDRLIGMVQLLAQTTPQPAKKSSIKIKLNPAFDHEPALASVGGLGRIVSFNESGDGRYVITLAGICRFRLLDEVHGLVPFRQGNIAPFIADLNEADEGDNVNRDDLLRTFRNYLTANQMDADWESIKRASNHTLVNALSMMSPFGPIEKQALLEAEDLKTRAETLVAMTELMLTRDEAGSSKLQ